MEQKTFENSEKANLLNREIEPAQPINSPWKRRHFIKGLVIAGLLWWSWTVLPELLRLHSREDSVRPTVKTDGFFDFSDVGLPQSLTSAPANPCLPFSRSRPVRNWNGTRASSLVNTSVLVSRFQWITIVP